jgi:signal transduction histidine kinase
VLLVVVLFTAVHGVVPIPEPAGPFPALIAVYTVAAHGTRRRSLASAALVAVAIPVILAFDPKLPGPFVVVLDYVVFSTAWLFGDAARHRRERLALLETAATETARSAVAVERTRIAREMHDVVAHHVSLMVVQAEAGPVLHDRSTLATAAAFDSIGATGRQALTELRRALGVLREADPEGVHSAPAIGEVTALADAVREAGLPTEVIVAGTPGPLPPATARTLYRIVQESLTNALKHSAGSRATVTLVYGGPTCTVHVHSEGSGTAGSDGHGLAGMRERVALVGGEFSAGPRDGGWEVTAVLPR